MSATVFTVNLIYTSIFFSKPFKSKSVFQSPVSLSYPP